ncbi:hypothetical protein NDU88_006292 [Pleurodeles waltl]|uniref:Uncharacterized protein n=1 Tax=Pleurodeles waltl TaxID=8319 RepID=A0AAV7QLB4_PLEWA|nr:hypothetical protein NDU88_006292 [Pleurodeles waltl]
MEHPPQARRGPRAQSGHSEQGHAGEVSLESVLGALPPGGPEDEAQDGGFHPRSAGALAQVPGPKCQSALQLLSGNEGLLKRACNICGHNSINSHNSIYSENSIASHIITSHNILSYYNILCWHRDYVLSCHNNDSIHNHDNIHNCSGHNYPNNNNSNGNSTHSDNFYHQQNFINYDYSQNNSSNRDKYKNNKNSSHKDYPSPDYNSSHNYYSGHDDASIHSIISRRRAYIISSPNIISCHISSGHITSRHNITPSHIIGFNHR